jgi:arsenate reductase (thioredoxin)
MPSSAEELALIDTDTVLGRAAERLADKYAGVFGPETIDCSPTTLSAPLTW